MTAVELSPDAAGALARDLRALAAGLGSCAAPPSGVPSPVDGAVAALLAQADALAFDVAAASEALADLLSEAVSASAAADTW